MIADAGRHIGIARGEPVQPLRPRAASSSAASSRRPARSSWRRCGTRSSARRSRGAGGVPEIVGRSFGEWAETARRHRARARPRHRRGRSRSRSRRRPTCRCQQRSSHRRRRSPCERSDQRSPRSPRSSSAALAGVHGAPAVRARRRRRREDRAAAARRRRPRATRRSTARSSRTGSPSSATTRCSTPTPTRMPRSSSSRPSRRSPPGAEVLVLDPVDAQAAVSIVAAANAQGVPVISYDRLVAGGDLAYYVSFDNEKVGELQATAFVDALEADGDEPAASSWSTARPPTTTRRCSARARTASSTRADLRDPRRVRHPGLEPRQGAGVGGRPDHAVRRRDRRRLRRERRHGERRDRGAQGGERRRRCPIVTGQDAELAAIQRIVTGDQYMTDLQGDQAAGRARRRGRGRAARRARGRRRRSRSTARRRRCSTPSSVTIDNILETVVADGFWTVDEICTPTYAAACAAAGLR